MSKVETVSLRIFGRDLTIACPPKEKDNLIKAANLLNEELDNISDKNNALIIAGLTLANKLLTSEPNNKSSSADADLSKLIKKIEKTLEK
jgi:cell division protein ZapA (FtsZ GTPase activity inhibitor)